MGIKMSRLNGQKKNWKKTGMTSDFRFTSLKSVFKMPYDAFWFLKLKKNSMLMAFSKERFDFLLTWAS